MGSAASFAGQVACAEAENRAALRILHVYKTYLPEDFTGIPRVIHSISSALASAGVESHVLAIGGDGLPAEPTFVDGHFVHRAKRDMKVASTDLSWRVIGQFRELVSAVDIVHYHFPWPVGDMLYWFAGRHRPAIVTYHSDIVRQKTLRSLYAPLMHSFLGAARHVVATSPNYLTSSEVLKGYADKVSIIPIGLGARPATDALVRETCRAKVGEGFFLFLGTMRYYKGIPFLIEAARRSGLPVVLAGVEDPCLLRAIPPNVTVLGEVSEEEKEALFELCGAFVLPSHLRSEAFGVSMLEAARAGKPLISCEIGTGTSYVNLNGETGLVIRPADPDAIVTAMQFFVVNPEVGWRMGRRAQERFAEHFTAERMARSYLELYSLSQGRLDQSNAA